MGKFITNQQLTELANSYGIELAALKAVIEVESRGDGFYSTGEPVVLFEGHQFHKFTRGKFSKTHPELSYPDWTSKWYKYNQPDRVDEAAELDFKAAILSTSWGCMQVMGFNYKLVGYETPEDFVKAMFLSEYNQIKAGLEYIKNADLLDEIKFKAWRAFARGYNGKGYAKNNYHVKLQTAYTKYNK